MKNLGLETKEGLAVTGVKAYLNEEEKTNVSLALIGELDALRIPEHKYANPETQGAHCCGHHAQLAGVIGPGYRPPHRRQGYQHWFSLQQRFRLQGHSL